MSSIPESTRVLVIGGGPGGSTAATLLARQGFAVTLFEKSKFPRYHIGESLLPTILEVLDLLGARDKLEAFGFQRKHGAFLEWGPEQWSLNFGELSANFTYSFQVVRSEFDQMLLEHARSQGVQVFENVEVDSLTFTGDRPTSARWSRKTEASNGGGNGHARQGEIQFDYMIDASGRHGIMANKYLHNRRFHKVFQNVAVWGYWENADRLATGREGDIAVGSIPHGWLWGIPLHDGTMSVGVVMHKDSLNAKRAQGLDQIYAEAIEASPIMKQVVSTGKLVSSLHVEQDYSYAAQSFCGPGYFLVGDAACFLDPLLSSGVHLATYSAVLAAASLGSFYRGEVTEDEAMGFYEQCYRQAYLRILVFLSAFYDVGRKKEEYFWEAQRLTPDDVEATDLKRAFLKLVTGVKDITEAQEQSTHHVLLEEMTKRVDENLNLRKDKHHLAELHAEHDTTTAANARFFNSVEGLFALNEHDAVNGLYVSTRPHLGLARVYAGDRVEEPPAAAEPA